MQYGILMFPQHPVDVAVVARQAEARFDSLWVGEHRSCRAQYLALSGLPDVRILTPMGGLWTTFVTLARASAVTTRLAGHRHHPCPGARNPLLLVKEIATLDESKEILGIRPPQAAPEPQCLCPDTSA